MFFSRISDWHNPTWDTCCTKPGKGPLVPQNILAALCFWSSSWLSLVVPTAAGDTSYKLSIPHSQTVAHNQGLVSGGSETGRGSQSCCEHSSLENKPQIALSWNRAATYVSLAKLLLLSLSAQQGSGPGFQSPCSFAAAGGIKGNSDSCCGITGTKEAEEEQPGAFIKAAVPSLQQALWESSVSPGLPGQQI